MCQNSARKKEPLADRGCEVLPTCPGFGGRGPRLTVRAAKRVSVSSG